MNGAFLVNCALLINPWGILTVLGECFNPKIAFHHDKVDLFLLVGIIVWKFLRDEYETVVTPWKCITCPPQENTWSLY